MAQKPLVHFDISERKVLLRIMDIFWVLFTLTLVSVIFEFDYFRISPDHWAWTLVLIVYLVIFSSIFELYDLQKASKFEIVLKNVILTVSATVLFFMLTPYFTPSLPANRLQILFFFLSLIAALLIWRFAYITLISSPRFYKKALLIGDIAELNLMVEALQKSDPNYVIIGYINTGENSEQFINPELQKFEASQLKSIIEVENINEIVVASSSTRSKDVTASLLKDLNSLLIQGFPIKDYTQVYENLTYRVPVQHIGKDFYKFFLFSRSNHNKFYLFFLRVFDIFMAMIGLLVCFVLIPFIFVVNLVANKGSLFYSQERVGKNAKKFKINKFRTMLKDAEINGPQWSEKGDHRITSFGLFLRRSRLDEFPQFFNILKGEMSIIGPRPERPVFVKELSKKLPFYKTRHIVKPGLTGWAQVKANYGSSYTDSLEKLQYDLYYIKHRGLFLDLNILLKTFSTILFFRGQ
ncbi:exopolysaccharide biosynthesis polyprenyl glycosylphosphotransferase [Gillisia sp. Hel_I_86]|uniref:sugar transferase n=1 Tax=Gillisia sp. Hel_I_86 TaxID=1249981 RepID=UPI0011994C81|nr:sugar transferase [Gillisia sp. Hel_I_86]TVZ25555.1 exopolysaccharide biosynthesis polyprenyl glycosylphosphotransferase [Gillisia sp. Hel_I_86]